MSPRTTLSDTLQPTTICILSPVRIKEATFVKLGVLHSRSIRLVHGDLPEHAAGEDYEETTYVAQLSLHLTHCDELIRLPLIILEEESHFDFTYNLTVDFREESELMQQIMPHFSSHSIYHYDSVQCDVNVFELIATARAGLPAHPTTHRSGQAGQPVSSLNEKWAPPVSGVPADHSDPMFSNDQLGRKQADEDISRQPRSQLNTVLFAPLTPSKSLARKVRTSVRKLTNRQKSGHQRTTSNPQLVMDTIGIDRGHWNPKPSCSYESTISINLGSYDD